MSVFVIKAEDPKIRLKQNSRLSWYLWYMVPVYIFLVPLYIFLRTDNDIPEDTYVRAHSPLSVLHCRLRGTPLRTPAQRVAVALPSLSKTDNHSTSNTPDKGESIRAYISYVLYLVVCLEKILLPLRSVARGACRRRQQLLFCLLLPRAEHIVNASSSVSDADL